MSRWTDQDDQALRRLWSDLSLSLHAIGAQLGRSRNAVHSRAGKLGLPSRSAWTRWTDEDDARLRALYAEGLKGSEIAYRLGRSLNSVQQRLSALGVATRQKRWTEGEIERARRLKREGVHLREIARRLGRDKREVSRQTRGIRARRVWSEQDDATLLALAHSLDEAELGELLGRTRRAVRGRLDVLRARQRRERRQAKAPAPAVAAPEDDLPRLPATRAECAGGQRPCPFVSCKYHLYLDVNPRTGTIKLNFPDLEVWELPETCALDVADRGEQTLAQIGALLNRTRERVRQIEEAAKERAQGAARRLT